QESSPESSSGLSAGKCSGGCVRCWKKKRGKKYDCIYQGKNGGCGKGLRHRGKRRNRISDLYARFHAGMSPCGDGSKDSHLLPRPGRCGFPVWFPHRRRSESVPAADRRKWYRAESGAGYIIGADTGRSSVRRFGRRCERAGQSSRNRKENGAETDPGTER